MSLLLAFSGVGAATEGAAQDVDGRLGEPDATYREAFALIQSVRELADGRVMAADPLGQLLVVLDLKRGSADTLGGVGQGPGEYRQPDAVFALPGDSTLLVDLGNARLITVAPDGSFAETMPMTRGEPGPGGGLMIIRPAGVDASGRIYFEPFGGGIGGAIPDSSPIVRWDRRTGVMDTVARVKRPEMKRSASGGAGDRSVRIMPVPLSPEDAWAVAPDGRVAVARAPDYRVDWIAPNGRVVSGEPVAYDPVRIRSADRGEWLEGLGGGLRVSLSVENGQRRVSLARGPGGQGGPDPERLEWPEFKPPFMASSVCVAPTGDVWVRRHVPAGRPGAIDIFGADGRRRRSLMLPPDRRIVGFGRGVLFLVHSDEMGLQWLERYRRPVGT
jgi:hypothetical protein